jgi:chorismate synthase
VPIVEAMVWMVLADAALAARSRPAALSPSVEEPL